MMLLLRASICFQIRFKRLLEILSTMRAATALCFLLFFFRFGIAAVCLIADILTYMYVQVLSNPINAQSAKYTFQQLCELLMASDEQKKKTSLRRYCAVF